MAKKRGYIKLKLSQSAREAQREYMRNWRANNKDHLNAYMKQWREDNPEKVKQYQRNFWEKKGEGLENGRD